MKKGGLGRGAGGLGIGDGGLGPIPNPQSPIPNPQSPSKNFVLLNFLINLKKNKFKNNSFNRINYIKYFS